MISINKYDNKLLFEYNVEQKNSGWIDEAFDKNGEVYFKQRIFTFVRSDINTENTKNYFQSGDVTFVLGKLEGTPFRHQLARLFHHDTCLESELIEVQKIVK